MLDFSLYFYSEIFNLHFHVHWQQKEILLSHRVIFHSLISNISFQYFPFHKLNHTHLLSQIILTFYFSISTLPAKFYHCIIKWNRWTKLPEQIILPPLILWLPLPNDVPAPDFTPSIPFFAQQHEWSFYNRCQIMSLLHTPLSEWKPKSQQWLTRLSRIWFLATFLIPSLIPLALATLAPLVFPNIQGP